MPQTTKKPTRSASTKTKPKKKAVPEFAKPFYKKRWFAIFALILVFSSIGGGYMLRRGDAASYTFIMRNGDIRHTATQKANEGVIKRDGITYYLVTQASTGLNTTIETTPPAVASANSRRYCAHFKVFKGPAAGRTVPIEIYYRYTKDGRSLVESGDWITTITSSTKSGNVCIPKSSNRAEKIYVYSGHGGTSIGVDTIYGKP